MNLKYILVLQIIIIGILIIRDVNCSDFENLSYGQDVLSGKASPTQAPIETTTKKKGFFSGIKKLFGGGKTTTTEDPLIVETSSTTSTTAKPITSSTTPATAIKPNQNRDFVAPTPSNSPAPTPSKSPAPTPPSSSPTNSNNLNNKGTFSNSAFITLSTTAKPDNRRDFVPPRPAPAVPAPPVSSSTSTTTTTVKPDNRRDYVAPPRSPSPVIPPSNAPTFPTAKPDNRGHFLTPTRSSSPPPVPPRPTSFSPNAPQFPTQPSNRRDYVNPNFPSGGQGVSSSTQVPPVPPRPGSPNILDDKDFPPLGPSRGSQRPASPTPAPTRSPGNRVNFVPHAPGGSKTTTTTKNQLATDNELETLTEQLLSKDVNNQNHHVTINIQGKTKSTDRTDEAPEKLLDVKEQALQSPTIAKMKPLFNNYEIDTSVNEHVTPIEHKEENDFVDAIMATNVMRTAMQFLQNKGVVTQDPKTHREYVKTLWFTLYSRGGGRIGSSAFEHVFLNEIKNGTVIGMHNWVYYYEEEKLGHADYKGYIRQVDLGDKGAILKYRFNYNGLEKYANTLFIGTSPELEMALYTVCFAVRADQECPISLNQHKVNIVTHTWKYRGKQLIGSAYPEI